MSTKKERINSNDDEIKNEAANLCFDFLWMEIEKSNGADVRVGIVTMEQLKVFAQKVHQSGFLSGVNFERYK